MSTTRYDVIVVGARAAGAPTAMLLARAGHRVLLVDRASFPSDTVSTHLVHPPGVAAWRRWGLLDRIVDSGCPPIHTYAFDFGPFTLTGSPGERVTDVAYAPRRTVLDRILVDAAARAGAEVRERFTVEGLEHDGDLVVGIRGRHGRSTVVERAAIVVGADGRHSTVAEAVAADTYETREPLQASYYAYFSGLPMDGVFEAYVRPHAAFGVWPTTDGLTVVIAGRPIAAFDAYRRDIEDTFRATIDLAPAFAERFSAARRESRFVGASVPGYLRRPSGPGWVLVGDAGYNRDFITALGISDAYQGAQAVAEAIGAVLNGKTTLEDAMGRYQAGRDAQVRPFAAFTAELASLEPPAPEMARALASIEGDQAAMDRFVRVTAGVTDPAEMFASHSPSVTPHALAAGVT